MLWRLRFLSRWIRKHCGEVSGISRPHNVRGSFSSISEHVWSATLCQNKFVGSRLFQNILFLNVGRKQARVNETQRMLRKSLDSMHSFSLCSQNHLAGLPPIPKSSMEVQEQRTCSALKGIHARQIGCQIDIFLLFQAFKDISKYFSKEEWAKLSHSEKITYVYMKRNYTTMTNLGKSELWVQTSPSVLQALSILWLLLSLLL